MADFSRTRQTERLLLRMPVAADLAFITDLFLRPEMIAHRPDPRPDTPEQSAERLNSDLAHWREHGFGRWAVENENQLIGFGGVTVSTAFGGLNMSYHIHPDFWGRGYASEITTAACDFAFMELHAERVIGLARMANAASRRVLEKCGFVFEREVPLHGAPTNLYGMTRPGKFGPG